MIILVSLKNFWWLQQLDEWRNANVTKSVIKMIFIECNCQCVRMKITYFSRRCIHANSDKGHDLLIICNLRPEISG